MSAGFIKDKTLIFKKKFVVKKLGEGLTSKVYKVRINKKFYTIKKLKYSYTATVSYYREIDALKLLNGKCNTPKLRNYYEDDKYYYIVIDFIKGNTLFEDINKLTKKKKILSKKVAKTIFLDILNIIKFCHLNNLAHRDIKLENLIINDKSKITLIDFGFAEKICENNLKVVSMSTCGSMHYAAPELINNGLYFDMEPDLIDIWALGVLLFILRTGTFPFIGDTNKETFEAIKDIDIKFTSNVDDNFKDLIKKIFRVAPVDRLSLDEIKSHKWFK